MMLSRLRSMRPAEIVFRSRQELLKRLERIGMIGNGSSRPCFILGTQHLEGERLLDRFRGAASARFFEGVVCGQTQVHLEDGIPGERKQLVASAEAICQRRFDLLGYRDLFFGDPMDWHLDPISKRRTPLVHWSRLDPLDPTVVGDSKMVWELNRHQWLVRLGQAYQLTGNEHYAEYFVMSILDWMQANPPGQGINWTSSLEAAIRLISWCWALFLFRESKALSSELFLQMLEQIRIHAAHVERYLSYYFSPNTHLTGEALGLFYAGTVFPELREAAHWRRLGARILTDQILRQVLSDGVYFEQSTCYQRYTVEIYLHFLILAMRNAWTVPTAVGEHVQKMMDFLLAIRRPDGSMPQIGDHDGGWLLPLTKRSPDDFRGIFSTAAVLFGRPDYAWAAGGFGPETLWLLGPAGKKVFDALCPAPPATAISCFFPEGGYAVMRNGWEPDSHHLIFDVGPLGCPLSAGHGHADFLSVQCSIFGKPCLVDPGTYGYTVQRAEASERGRLHPAPPVEGATQAPIIEPQWRNYFRSTTAHTTVVIDGVGQAAPAGPFSWRSRPQARLRHWISAEAYDLADAEHDAYHRLPDPVFHRRRVLFVKPRYWVLVDDLDGVAEHRVELRFQFAPMPVTVDPTLWARAFVPGGSGLWIRPFATVPLEAEVHEGELAPIQGWVSPDYGQRQPAPVLIYTTMSQLPLRIVTVLIPVENPTDAPPEVSLSIGKGPEPVCLFFQDVQETIIMNEQDIIMEHR